MPEDVRRRPKTCDGNLRIFEYLWFNMLKSVQNTVQLDPFTFPEKKLILFMQFTF